MSWESLLSPVLDAVSEAGRLAMRHFRERPQGWDKSPDNPVTQADLEVDALLNERLLALDPGVGWLSEETKDAPARLASRRIWIVDPIDGTKEFIEGVPQFAISVALAEEGAPVLAVVHNPARGETFTAIRGGGARFGDLPARVTDRSDLRGARALASRSEVKKGEWDAFQGLFEMQATGSIAYKLALIASGQADLTFSQGAKHEWDVAAGVLLVQEAGGIACGLGGVPLVFNQARPKVPGIVACPAGLKDDLISRLPTSPIRL